MEKGLNKLELDINPQFVTAELIKAYCSSPRSYRTLLHALQVATLGKYLMVIEDRECDYNKIMDVYLAGLWHDAVYTVGNPNNETASAGLFSCHYPANTNVARLISKTTIADHLSEEPADIQLACLLDADLASLSVPFDEFMLNNSNICTEQECTHSQSSTFLLKFLDKKSIYRTRYCQEHHEAIARKNIKEYYNLYN
jgi:predicted metal-dependent HD superfamily phosphohydrolase